MDADQTLEVVVLLVLLLFPSQLQTLSHERHETNVFRVAHEVAPLDPHLDQEEGVLQQERLVVGEPTKI